MKRIEKVELIGISMMPIPEGMPPDVAERWGIYPTAYYREAWAKRSFIYRWWNRLRYFLGYGQKIRFSAWVKKIKES